MMWAGENCKLSGILKDKVRWIQEDAMKFVQREIRRGAKYDGVVMDPPRFGRGSSGEVWKLEEHLPSLVRGARLLLSPTPRLLLVNAYTADLSSVALGNLLSEIIGSEVEHGELGLKETTNRGFVMPAGIFARWG
jgi:23S rRNA (cytosine1962-C5)-methyltransferase